MVYPDKLEFELEKLVESDIDRQLVAGYLPGKKWKTWVFIKGGAGIAIFDAHLKEAYGVFYDIKEISRTEGGFAPYQMQFNPPSLMMEFSAKVVK